MKRSPFEIAGRDERETTKSRLNSAPSLHCSNLAPDEISPIASVAATPIAPDVSTFETAISDHSAHTSSTRYEERQGRQTEARLEETKVENSSTSHTPTFSGDGFPAFCNEKKVSDSPSTSLRHGVNAEKNDSEAKIPQTEGLETEVPQALRHRDLRSRTLEFPLLRWIFDLLENLLAPSSVWKTPWCNEKQREEAYALETLELFRQRLRLISFLGLISLGAYAAAYAALAPASLMPLASSFGFLCAVSLLMFFVARRIPKIGALHFFCRAMYITFSLGAAIILVFLGPNRGYVTGGHSNIVLSALLLPLMAHECLFIGLIAISAQTFAGWQTLMPDQSSLFYANLFSLCNTTLFVVVIAYFQNLLRRRAFDAAFDIALSASRLQNLSVTDTLTGGFNRRHIESVLNIEMARAMRFNRPLSVLMFDLDNFKKVNDSKGHAAGDRVLVETWNTACTAIREVDTLARYGGDEFVVVLPESDESAAQRVADRLKTNIRRQFHQSFGENSCEANVTLSIGVVTLRPQKSLSSDEILALADAQLYTAKKNGKNAISA